MEDSYFQRALLRRESGRNLGRDNNALFDNRSRGHTDESSSSNDLYDM